MGHADVKTTEIYTYVMEKDITVVTSPLDALQSAEKDFREKSDFERKNN